MRLVTKKGVGLTVLLELFAHIAISFSPMAVPLSLLFAMIYTLNKLSEDSEIVAIRSMGARKIDLFKPFLVIGLILAVTIFSLNRNLIPYSKRLFKNTVVTLTSKGFLADIKKEQFYTDIPGVILFAEDVTSSGKEMENVFIKLKKSAGKDKVIMAKKGVLNKPEGAAATELNLRLDLYNGNIISLKDNTEVEKIIFDKYEFPIVSSSSVGFVNKDSMRSSDELSAIIDDLKQKIKNEKRKDISEELKSSFRRTSLEYWTRFNVPLQCLAFVLLGFVFGVKKGRGRSQNTSAIALIVTIFYYALFFGGISLAKKGTLPAFIVIFLPTIIIFGIASWYYKKLDWAS